MNDNRYRIVRRKNRYRKMIESNEVDENESKVAESRWRNN